MATPAPPPATFLGGLGRYLARHPVLALALLTPGIPEYLSGSSSPVGLLISPPLFVLFLLANLGLYAAGVLLIREAKVRWGLGWGSVLVLGVAYGIAEEGLALDTLFNPLAGPVSPSNAGHLLGVNWLWSSEILVFHALFSVALPIFLWETAFPGRRDHPLLGRSALRVVLGLYGTTIALLGLALAASTYWMGYPVLVGSFLAIAGLILLARALPRDALTLRAGPPTLSPNRLFLLGASVLPALILLPGLLGGIGLPFEAILPVAPALATAILATFLRHGGTIGAGPAHVAFAAGLILPVAALGVIFALRFPAGLPLVLLVDLLAALFLRYLYRRAKRSGGAPVTPGLANPPTPWIPVEPAAAPARG